MKTQLLFSNKARRIGWILLIPAAVLGLLNIFFNYEIPFLDLPVLTLYDDVLFSGKKVFAIVSANVTPTVAGIFFIAGAILVAFSREKEEDEFIAKIRLDSLLWATYINYAVLVFCFIFFFGMGFFWVMIFNMFTILIIFIIRFNYVLYKTRKGLQDEK